MARYRGGVDRKEPPVTHAPPPDPLWYPSPAPPDPVLQPPTPMPWESPDPAGAPTPTPTPPMSPPSTPAPAPGRASPRPTAPIRPRQPAAAGSRRPASATPTTPSPPRWPPASTQRTTASTHRSGPAQGTPHTTQAGRPPAKKRRASGRSIGLAIVLLFCGWNIVANFIPHNRTTVDGPITTTPRPQQTTLPAPSLSAPVATVEGGPSTSFGLSIGTAARFSDQDGTWSVALLGVARIDRCEDLLG